MRRTMKLAWWIWGLIALLVVGYGVPYTVLAGAERWSAGFLFWTLFGIAVWALLIVATGQWNVRGPAPKDDEPERTD